MTAAPAPTTADDRLTFTLDVEEHRPDAAAEYRLEAATHLLLDFCSERDIVGTVFIVGNLGESFPGLVAEIGARGHEIGLHAWEHTPMTELSREEVRSGTQRGKALLEDLSEQEVVGFRAPTFSIDRSNLWVTEVLQELGFGYSSSILPAWNPLYGFPGLPREPFRWPSGLLELPPPMVMLGPAGVPAVGGTYLRILPWPVIRWGGRRANRNDVPFTYCHPYDVDVDEPFWVVPELGRVGSRLLWARRRLMVRRLDRILADGAGPPLRDRLADVGEPAVPGALHGP